MENILKDTENTTDMEWAQIEKESEEMIAFNNITKENATFAQTEGGFISLDYNGVHYDRINVIRLFPFTDKNKFISIKTFDARPKEIGIINDLDEMDEDVKEMLIKQLSLRYFTPVISKIINIKDEYGYAYFHVMTDKGECKFTITLFKFITDIFTTGNTTFTYCP